MTYDAWNPGLRSDIPARLMPLVTLYRPENGAVGYDAAREAARFCGLKPQDMIAFSVPRLVKHELLIRVTADLSVPDGPSYEELGINLRGMVACIFDTYASPQMAKFEEAVGRLRDQARVVMDRCLAEAFAEPRGEGNTPGLLTRLFGGKAEMPAPLPDPLTVLRSLSVSDQDKPALDALTRIAEGIARVRGKLLPDRDLISGFALNLFTNAEAGRVIGEVLDPIMRHAAKAQGYRYLPTQEKPFIMNVKGASASGKSTIRPQQRALADKLGIPWENFALISPDYWRKYLLDYESLGDDHKYAAMLTGQELEIIDKKLDLYVAQKAARGSLTHLLIDRFRFDSFSTDSEGKISSRLLTRFGHTVFLFFLVTPPAATVERAWKRGLSTGRYKAVDDLLYHNIEAYTGMPELFLTWVGSADKDIHFEFLDNSVALGERPRTIAYGSNDRMVILNVETLHNIDRYRAVNVNAEHPRDVLEDAPELTFLDKCVAQFESVTLMDAKTGATQKRARHGAWQEKLEDFSEAQIQEDRSLTLGAW